MLRQELKRVGRDLPDIPVLDTMGPLVGVAGLSVKQPSLATLATELSLINPNPHDALADANTCAQAAIELLARARRAGIGDRAGLLEACSTPTTHGIAAGTTRLPSTIAASTPQLPPEHAELHLEPLSARAGTKMLEAWRQQLLECARLRCPDLTAKIDAAGPNPGRLLPVVEHALTDSRGRRHRRHRRAARRTAAAARTSPGAELPGRPAQGSTRLGRTCRPSA